MGKITSSFLFKILTVIALESFVCCLETNKILDSTGVNGTRKNISLPLSTDRIPILSSARKWKVGRVSRKHYEIVNMVWRKTKIFDDTEPTLPTEMRFRRNNIKTTKHYEELKPLTYKSSRALIVPSTPSYIEFYYLDDNDERVKRRDNFIPNLGNSRRNKKDSNDNIFLQSPVLSFRVNDHLHKPRQKDIQTTNRKTTQSYKPRQTPVNDKPSIYGFLSSRFKIGFGPIAKPIPRNNFITSNYLTSTTYFNNETCPSTTLSEITGNTTSYPKTEFSIKSYEETTLESTIYDKIKFFEIYDDHTIRPSTNIDKVISHADDSENFVGDNEIVNQKTYLEDVHRSIGHYDSNKIKNVKKHINVNNSLVYKIETTEKHINLQHVSFNNISKTATVPRNNSRKIFANSSRVALWSDYPFAAVYVYEPSQIHCDAAALSPHWLVAAGSCLSRFDNKDEETDARSAYVAYCGQSWWRSERLTYVKYSIVHPRFHPKDAIRRYMYNIGLVQVVGSMSSCFGWAPVALMSHHFAAGPGGSMATAVGWGLDRYDVRYSHVVLPKHPLSAFDSFVYSESCPGSTTFGKGKFINGESTMKNTYCISLPPYFGEQNDPVHGSLLLVGGKLIALYLQEERRFWGEQSAQYTGVWRLVPWVHEVAREPDEIDGFAIDL